MPPASHQVSATSLKLLIQQIHPHVRVERDSGMPLTVLARHVSENIRNHASSAQCSVSKYGQKLQAVAGGKGGATRTLHVAFLAALDYSLF
jgi:hypothetical protein